MFLAEPDLKAGGPPLRLKKNKKKKILLKMERRYFHYSRIVSNYILLHITVTQKSYHIDKRVPKKKTTLEICLKWPKTCLKRILNALALCKA